MMGYGKGSTCGSACCTPAPGGPSARMAFKMTRMPMDSHLEDDSTMSITNTGIATTGMGITTTMLGKDTGTWSSTPLEEKKFPMLGDDPNTWSPIPLEPEISPMLGADPNTWSPTPLEEKKFPMLGDDPNTWSPIPLEPEISPMLGADPNTWSPTPLEEKEVLKKTAEVLKKVETVKLTSSRPLISSKPPGCPAGCKPIFGPTARSILFASTSSFHSEPAGWCGKGCEPIPRE